MTRAFLSLGSNLGDRLGYLRAAVESLGRGAAARVLGVSRVYETEPVEVEGIQPDYLNCVVEVEYGASALELLHLCQGIEAALGRDRKGEKLPRTVDLDLLLFGEEVLEEPSLVVPHPGIVRPFNLRGLVDLDPDLLIPGHGTVTDLLESVSLRGVVPYKEDL